MLHREISDPHLITEAHWKFFDIEPFFEVLS